MAISSCFTAEREDVATGGSVIYSYHSLKVWDTDSGRELRTFPIHSLSVNSVAVSTDGRIAISASDDNMIKVWGLETGVLFATFTCDSAVRCCTFLNDRKLIMAGDEAGRVHFLHLEEPSAKR